MGNWNTGFQTGFKWNATYNKFAIRLSKKSQTMFNYKQLSNMFKLQYGGNGA